MPVLGNIIRNLPAWISLIIKWTGFQHLEGDAIPFQCNVDSLLTLKPLADLLGGELWWSYDFSKCSSALFFSDIFMVFIMSPEITSNICSQCIL